MTLQLNGRAAHWAGLDDGKDRLVIRLNDPEAWPMRPNDFALVRGSEDLEKAVSEGWHSIFAVMGDLPSREVGVSRLIIAPPAFDYVGEGDLLGFQVSSGKLRSLFRRNSPHNSFLVTERCNHWCVMCSQPPKDVNDRWLLEEIKASIPLIDPGTLSLTLTGGEPLTDWMDLTEILRGCREHLPKTWIQVLTNGRAFAQSEIVKAWADLKHERLMPAIPVYSSVDHVHDHVVQSKGAFDETVLGILKLKDHGQRVGLRVVLHALTAPTIERTCTWIARNLPFVDHVALMGLENIGFAIANEDTLWIDPVDYADQLAAGVQHLVAAGANVSVFNLPRCLMPRAIWQFASKSISDWKNGFQVECVDCIERPNCSGFFTSGRTRFSRGIKAIPAGAVA